MVDLIVQENPSEIVQAQIHAPLIANGAHGVNVASPVVQERKRGPVKLKLNLEEEIVKVHQERVVIYKIAPLIASGPNGVPVVKPVDRECKKELCFVKENRMTV